MSPFEIASPTATTAVAYSHAASSVTASVATFLPGTHPIQVELGCPLAPDQSEGYTVTSIAILQELHLKYKPTGMV